MTILLQASDLANRRGECNRNPKDCTADGLQRPIKQFYALHMGTLPSGTISVMFIAQRSEKDDDGYARAAAAMGDLSACQPGYIGIDSVRGHDGLGITISYWASEADAKAWRDHPEHIAIREAGRDRWYTSYSLHVAMITRSYDWQKT
ncbi:antibiotic biosynthesis monooxygenase [Sphingorhabdus profundilacus]